MFECSKDCDGHKFATQLPYILFIPVSCLRTVKPKGFKLFAFSAGKETMHSPSKAHSRINTALQRKFLLLMLCFILMLHQMFKYWETHFIITSEYFQQHFYMPLCPLHATSGLPACER